MKRNRTIRVVLAAAFASAFFAMPAFADQPCPQPPAQGQAQPIHKEAVVQTTTATATVEMVNQSKRQLLLKNPQGREFTVTVPESVTRFDNIEPGDRVSVNYYQAVALSLKKGNAQEAPSAKKTTTVERTSGNLPGGMVARTVTASVQLVNVDRNSNTVTIKGPGGDIDTIQVTDPTVQADLAKLRPGERVQATYTEAIAIHVTPETATPPAG